MQQILLDEKEEENKRKSKKFWGWALPAITFAAVIIFSAVTVTTYVNRLAKSTVETELEQMVQLNATKLKTDLDMTLASAAPVGGYLAKGEIDKEAMTEAARILTDSTDAYMVVIAGEDGIGYTQDGTRLELSTVPYFISCTATTKANYTVVSDDGVTGDGAIIVSKPLSLEYSERYYAFYFINKVRFMSSIHYEKMRAEVSFLVDKNGEILATNFEEHSYASDGKLWDNLKDSLVQSRTARSLIGNRKQGYLTSEDGGSLVMAPTGISDWYLVTKVSQYAEDALYAAFWKSARKLLNCLIIAGLLFIFTLIIVILVEHRRARKEHENLSEKAERDQLTDLYNKVSTEEAIRKYIEANPEGNGALFILDIDNFKGINDNLGHAFGDEALRSFATGISQLFRVSDIYGRIGGDEFMIFVKDMPDEKIQESCGKIQEFISDFTAGKGYIKHKITASVGGAKFPEHGETFEILYKSADIALYESKKSGKCRVTMAERKAQNADL